ncbi:toll/interleukin-1 receptor domain-containing protein [Frankia sp. CiP1_Cm_nod2]|uniref:toll/interleukin-1 receptor domain-containing protein n=1 Tax=Frankia sp. CiP1_Cm_nod2 TaxID=2897161 RepID=UPI002024959D
MVDGGDTGGNPHFFVSYTQTDRAWAEWIAWTLEDAGYRVLIQAWDFAPGSNWVSGMQEGVMRAARTIAVLSADYARSVYGAAEWQAAWAADPAGQARKLLAVRVTDCDRPELLNQIVSIDLFGVGEAAARAELLRAAGLAVSGERGKPVSAPPFPPMLRAITGPVSFPSGLPTVSSEPWPQNPNLTGQGGLLNGSWARDIKELYEVREYIDRTVLIEFQRRILETRFRSPNEQGDSIHVGDLSE